MPRRSRRCFVLIGLLALASCRQNRNLSSAVGSAPRADAGATASAELPTVTEEESEDALDPRTRGWDVGRRYTYRLRMTSEVTLGNGKVADFDLLGDLAVIPVKVTPHTATLFMTLEGGKFVSRLPGTQADLDERAAKLAAPYFVTLSAGRVTEAQVAKGSDAIAVNVYRTLSDALQFAAPAAAKDAWTAFEYDTTGQYAAGYERGAAPGAFRRKKSRYLAVLFEGDKETRSPLDLSPEIVFSEGAIQLASDGRPLDVAMLDELRMQHAESPIHAKTTVSLHAEAVSSANDGAKLDALLARCELLRAHQPYGGEVAPGALDDARIGGLRFDTILARLEKSAAADGSKTPADKAVPEGAAQEEAHLFTALAASLRKEPDGIEKAKARIEAGSPASQVLVDALASAGSDAAQATLARLLSSKFADAQMKSSIVLALSRTPRPSEPSVRTLMALASGEPASVQALYGLGTFSRLLREDGKTELDRRIGEFLIGRLAGAKTEAAVSHALKALANAGYAPALGSVKRYLNDHREQIRIDAVTALRGMEAPEVDPLIAAQLESDPTDGVRMRAIEVAERRPPSDAVVRAIRAATSDASPHVRYRATKVIALWLPEHPELRSVIEAVARSDREKQIRALAEAAL